MIEEPNLFTYLNQVRNKLERYEYNPKIAGNYIILLGIANNNKDLKICNEVNQHLWSLQPGDVYNYFMEVLPKGNVFSKWPKKPAKDKEEEKEIKELMEKYNISKLEAVKLVKGV